MKLRPILFIIVFYFIVSCQTNPVYFYNQGYIYGTVYNITYESPSGKDFHEEITRKLDEYNLIFSTFDSSSVISKINDNKPVELHPLFLKCFNRAMQISEITGGAFDITVGPLVNAWGFGPDERQKMTLQKIDSLKEITGYRKIKLENGEIVKKVPAMKLDMSAIAKGYTSDLIADFLKEKKCENYMVEIGGEVVAKGTNEKGRIWTIGVRKPEEVSLFGSNQIMIKLQLPENALATSGNYQNFYEEDGKKYAHTINPETGMPVEHSLLSATVLTDNCMDADAFATAFMVLGLEKSIEISGQYPELKVCFIYGDDEGEMKVYYSDNFRKHILP